MMEYNEQETSQNLTIITTNNRTLDNLVDGVIPGFTLNTADVLKDNLNSHQLTTKELTNLKKNRNKPYWMKKQIHHCLPFDQSLKLVNNANQNETEHYQLKARSFYFEL